MRRKRRAKTLGKPRGIGLMRGKGWLTNKYNLTCLYCHKGRRYFENRYCNIVCADAADGILTRAEWERFQSSWSGIK